MNGVCTNVVHLHKNHLQYYRVSGGWLQLELGYDVVCLCVARVTTTPM